MFSHPDADAFMRKYLERPSDATARLVFADWLEETGEPHNAAWAHFIRLKVEADRHPHNSGARHEIDRHAGQYALQIQARLTIPAKLFIGYPKSLLQLLPAANITVKLAGFEVPREVLELVPESVARENLVIPLDQQSRTLLVAAVNPHDADLAQKLEFILNRDIVFVGAGRDDVQQALDRHYGEWNVEYVDSVLYENPETVHPLDSHPTLEQATDPDSPVARLVSLIIQEAINLRADRILITPEPDSAAVRYRITDEWVERDRLPSRVFAPVTTRIGLMSMILPLEWIFSDPYRDTPLIGLIPIRVHGMSFRLRVSIQPSPDGPTTQIDIAREPVG